MGVGGWTYEPWRGTFYPKGLPQKKELEYASRQLTAIEINGTFYRLQKPASFAKWLDETPDDFVFSVKAPRYATIRAALGEAGTAIERFLESGIAELGPKLGPLLWQFAPTKRYEAPEVEAFLQLLPKEIGGRKARNVIEPRHESFLCPGFVEQLRAHGAAAVFTDSDEYPSVGDGTADFIYARLMRSEASLATGYPAPALGRCVKLAGTWARGEEPEDIARICDPRKTASPRDVYVFFINGAKERAPAAAQAFLERLR